MSDLVADTENENELLLESAQGQRVLVRYTPAAFEVLEGQNARPLLSTSPRNVLRISVARKSDVPADRVPVTIAALALESGNLELWKRDYWIGSGSHDAAVAWSERVTSLCYDGMCSFTARNYGADAPHRSTAWSPSGFIAEPYRRKGQGKAARQDDCVADIRSSWLKG